MRHVTARLVDTSSGHDGPAAPDTARTTASRMNGASAKHTRGPRSPRPIAARPTGLAAYAVAATTAGSSAPVSARTSRYAPQIPSGNAPATTTVRASAACPSNTVESTDINPNAGVAGARAPSIV